MKKGDSISCPGHETDSGTATLGHVETRRGRQKDWQMRLGDVLQSESGGMVCFPKNINRIHDRRGFPGGSVVKNLPANAGDTGSIPGWGRSPGVGNGNPLQYFCLENPMDRAA